MSEVSKVENVPEEASGNSGRGERGVANGQGTCGSGEDELEGNNAEILPLDPMSLERRGKTRKRTSTKKRRGHGSDENDKCRRAKRRGRGTRPEELAKR